MIYAAINNVDLTSPITEFGQVLGYGGQMVLIGMLTIFAVLCLLWLCLAIFGKVFNKTAAPKEAKLEAAPAPVEVEVYTADDEEIVAVIAAAIAMAESECENKKFRVVSFRRK